MRAIRRRGGRMTLIEHEAREYSDMRYIMRKAEMSIK